MNVQTAFLFHTEEISYTPVSDKLIDSKEVKSMYIKLFLFFLIQDTR